MTTTVGYIGHSGHWTGVIRQDGKVLVECGHSHPNRDSGSKYKTGALSCIRWAVSAAQRPEAAKYAPSYVSAELIAKVAQAIGSARVEGMGYGR